MFSLMSCKKDSALIWIRGVIEIHDLFAASLVKLAGLWLGYSGATHDNYAFVVTQADRVRAPRQHFLNFSPDPHGHLSLRPILACPVLARVARLASVMISVLIMVWIGGPLLARHELLLQFPGWHCVGITEIYRQFRLFSDVGNDRLTDVNQ